MPKPRLNHLKTVKKPSKSRLGLVVLAFAVLGGTVVLSSFASPNPNLQGDLNNDNTVDVTDLSLLLSHYGANYPNADIDASGTVDITDLSILLSHYGQSYGGGGGGSASMYVGINETGWGAGAVSDIAGAVNFARVDTSIGESITDYVNAGVKVLAVIPGTCPTCGYSTGGVSSINATSFANSALSWYQTNCQGSTAICPAMELLNEPGGSWFWGSNASSTTNAAAYANLLATTYNTFHTQYGANSPLLLGSYDGGSAGSTSWGQEVYAANPSVGNYVDGWTDHPYGGCGDPNSALGQRDSVTAAHTNTGKPIWITEVGWPTDTGQSCTGDSDQWTEQQEADNIYNFVQWARSTGYVGAVTIYNYRDASSGNALYGIEHFDGTKKPAYNALKCAAQNLAENC